MTTGLDFANLFSPIQDTVMGAISAVIPIALAILGVVIAVRKGASLIRGLSGR